MDASSSSGGKEARLPDVNIPDLTFPVRRSGKAREVPSPEQAAIEAIQVIELSEAYLPLATARPDSEARRLELKTRVPFKILGEEAPSR